MESHGMRKLTLKELLEPQSPENHTWLLDKLADPGVRGVVVFENLALDSPHAHDFSSVVVGPNCTYKTIAECEGRYILDSLGHRQDAVAYYRKSKRVPK